MGSGGTGIEGIAIRPAVPEDDAAVIPLLGSTLGWHDDSRHQALFAWKHRANPFGGSPGWVAEDSAGVVGFRAFMRWEFCIGGQIFKALRAVDTATHPRAQGRGIFRALTLRGLSDTAHEGISFVFNTPNRASTPGYLSMGWRELGRLPIAVRPSGPIAVPKLLLSRKPSEIWSEPTAVGEPADGPLSDIESIEELLETLSVRRGSRDSESDAQLRTNRTARFLRWRYAGGPVAYRAVLVGRDVRDGLVLFRIRRRGPALEALISDIIVPQATPRREVHRVCRYIIDASGADYGIALGACRPRTWVRAPGAGPLLTWRALNWSEETPELRRWNVSASDIELF